MKEKIGYVNVLLILKREESVVIEALKKMSEIIFDPDGDRQLNEHMKQKINKEFDLEKTMILRLILIFLFLPLFAFIVGISYLITMHNVVAILLIVPLVFVFVLLIYKVTEYSQNIEEYKDYAKILNKSRKERMSALKKYYQVLNSLEVRLLGKVKEKNLLDDEYYFLFVYGSEDINNTKIFDTKKKKEIKQELLKYWIKIVGTNLQHSYLVSCIDSVGFDKCYVDVIDKNIDDFNRIFESLD